jgi:phosphosulfolactate phosphohydrolase-like enzyme
MSKTMIRTTNGTRIILVTQRKPDIFITSVAAVINTKRIIKPSFKSANKNSERQKRNKDARS